MRASRTTRVQVRLGLRVLALLPGAIAFLVPVVPAHAVTSAQIASIINTERKANGIPPVTEDSALSAGCAQYNQYRAMNGSLGDAFTPGAEKSSLPGYTAAGARASRDSLLNAGDTPDDTWANGDVFDSAPGHLVALMDPAVAVVGADQLDFGYGLYGTVSLTCVDVRSAPGRVPPRRIHAYLYRGPNGGVPVNPVYREGPPGNGPYLFLYLFAPVRARVSLLSLKITTAGGAPVPLAYVQFSGGLIDGRSHKGVRGQVANGTQPSNTRAATIRLKRPPTQQEKLMVKDLEQFQRYARDLERAWGLTPSNITVWR